MNYDLPRWLVERLRRPLPGVQVGSRFESRPHRWRYDAAPTAESRAAAVLLLLYPHENRWHLPLMVRPSNMAVHAGQISLPGGAVEPGETTDEAARREFHEELGAEGHPLDMLGPLSPIYVGGSDYLVTPWVAATASRPAMKPNPIEVAELLEAPLQDLLDPTHFGCETRPYDGHDCVIPYFLFQSHRIWGATCMILGEFVTVLEQGAVVP